MHLCEQESDVLHGTTTPTFHHHSWHSSSTQHDLKTYIVKMNDIGLIGLK